MVSLKEFQRKCLEAVKKKEDAEFDQLMADLIKEAEEKKFLEEWYILEEAQDRFGDDYKPITVWGGFKNDKCPCCKENLEKNFIKEKGLWDYLILYCLNCGYRYAKKAGNSNG